MALDFVLQPFSKLPPERQIQVGGRIERRGSMLAVDFLVSGHVAKVLADPLKPVKERQRADQLWERTCFEMFFADPASPVYREVNVSASGDWNIYRFTGIRTGMQPEEMARVRDVTLRRELDSMRMTFVVESKLFDSISKLAVSLNAVIENAAREKTYWALVHTQSRPDFHRREAFLVTL